MNRASPTSVVELSALFAAAYKRNERLGSVDVGCFNRVLEHTPEDMTVTVEAGLTLGELQMHLAKSRQWLAIDPPAPQQLDISTLLSWNLSGPRRFGYGTIRDYVLGLKVVLADGRIIHSGGKVVKNVAGFDLVKLFIGSQGTLGVIVEATFKLRPLPEAEAFVGTNLQTLAGADEMIQRILESDVAPTVMDLHSLGTRSEPTKRLELVVGFAGTSEEVEWQVAQGRTLGLSGNADLTHEAAFWHSSDGRGSSLASPVEERAGVTRSLIPFNAWREVRNFSVLPSDLCKVIADLGQVGFVARAGNGIVYYRGGPLPAKPDVPHRLMERVKDAYDPKRLLPDYYDPS